MSHISRSTTSPPEAVEEVCQALPLASTSYGGRLRLIGVTKAGRILTVILAPRQRSGSYYPVTARPASKGERQRFDESLADPPEKRHEQSRQAARPQVPLRR